MKLVYKEVTLVPGMPPILVLDSDLVDPLLQKFIDANGELRAAYDERNKIEWQIIDELHCRQDPKGGRDWRVDWVKAKESDPRFLASEARLTAVQHAYEAIIQACKEAGQFKIESNSKELQNLRVVETDEERQKRLREEWQRRAPFIHRAKPVHAMASVSADPPTAFMKDIKL